MKPMYVDGELLSARQVQDRLDMLKADCQKAAGEFWEQNRSELWRDAWRTAALKAGAKDAQAYYLKRSWQNFYDYVKFEVYMKAIQACDEIRMNGGTPKISLEDEVKMHQAIIISSCLGRHSQHVPIQVFKGTQQFEGDKYENAQTAQNYGTRAEHSPSLMRRLMGSTAY